MPVIAPDRTQEQRMEALALANSIRIANARYKEFVAAGDIDPFLAIQNCQTCIKVIDLLTAIPKIGRVKAVKMLHGAGVAAHKRMSGITSRQRHALQDQLRVVSTRYADW